MNINDPFGRLKQRREREYQTLCKSLREAGVTNRRDAQLLLERLMRRGKTGLFFTIPLTVLLALLLPEYQIVTIPIGILITAWLLKITSRSREHIERYIKEDLGDQSDGGNLSI